MNDSPQSAPVTTLPESLAQEKVIYLHGFDKKELFHIVDVIKKAVNDPRSIAFSTSTKNNLKMTVAQLIQEVRKDHVFMETRREAIRTGAPIPEIPKD